MLLSVVVVVEDKGCSETPGIIVLLLERIRNKIKEEEEVWAVRSEETIQRRHRHRVDYSGIRTTILLSNNKEEEEEGCLGTPTPRVSGNNNNNNNRPRVGFLGTRILRTLLLLREDKEEEDCSGDLQRVVVEGCSEEEVLQVDRVCSENRLVRRARQAREEDFLAAQEEEEEDWATRILRAVINQTKAVAVVSSAED